MKKIISNIVLTFLFCILICLYACQEPSQLKNDDLTPSTTANGAQNENVETFSDWKTAYLNFIERRESDLGIESKYGFNLRYALVYINNDDIPELYAMGACEADGDLICSYKNGHIIEQRLGRTLGGKYVERSGIFSNHNGHMGSYYDNVYMLDENGFSQILDASRTEHYVYFEKDRFEIENEYFIDGDPATKDEYDNAINAAINLSQAVKVYENSVSYDIIKQQIADCK